MQNFYCGADRLGDVEQEKKCGYALLVMNTKARKEGCK